MKSIKWIILIAVSVLMLVSPCVGAEVVGMKGSLRGIEGVEVMIEPLNPNIKELGLTQGMLRTDVELKLRLAGIKILSMDERYKTLGAPYLYLNINTIPHSETGLFAFSVSLDLRQDVDLRIQKDTMTIAPTWMQSFAGLAGYIVLKDTLRSNTKDLVDRFLNDYLAVNPKQADKPKKK